LRHCESRDDCAFAGASACDSIIADELATAKLNDIDPQAWLADILARVLDYPAKRIGDLLPWNWHAKRRAAA